MSVGAERSRSLSPTPSAKAGKAHATTHRMWFGRVVRLLGPARRDLYIGLGSAFGGTVLLVVTPILIRHIIDRSIVARDGRLRTWLTMLFVLSVVRSLFTYGRRMYVGRVSIEFERNTRLAMYRKLRSLDRVALEAFPPGQVVSRANGDVSSISQVLAFAPFVLGNALQVVLSLIAMLALSWKLSLVVGVMIPALIAIARPARRLQFAASLDVQQRQGAMAAFADESINGVRVIKGFGRERDVVSRFETLARELYKSRLRTVRIGARITPLLQLVPQLGVVALLIWGGWLAIDGAVSVGTFVAFATYLSQLVGPLRTSAILLTILETARAGATRVFELLDTEPTIADRPDAHTLVIGDGDSTDASLLVRVEAVTVRYGDTIVLDDVSFEIAAGETIALTGRSGSGKSTLALSLARFVEPSSGVIRVADHDIAQCTLDSVRAAVGVVFDDSFLFSRSVRENVSIGRPDATDEEIRAALRLAEAENFVDALPNGIDTVIGEQGMTLSGGQRQRINLARALLVDPDILVLDDVTSALDVVTEEAVFENLKRARANKTTIVVAQRRSSVMLADRVVLLERGRVQAVGTVTELERRFVDFSQLMDERVASADDEPSLISEGRSFGVTQPSMPMRPGGGPGMGVGGIGVGGGAGFPGPMAGSSFAAAAMDGAKIELPKASDVPVESPSDATAAAFDTSKPWGVWPSLKRQRGLLGVAALFVLFESSTSLFSPLFVKRGLERGVQRSDSGALYSSAGWFAISLLVAVIVAYFSALTVGLLGERMLYRLRLRVFAQLQRLGLDFYERELTGRLLTRVTGDVDALGNVLQQGVISLVVNAVTFVVLSVFLFRTNPRIAGVIILTFPPLVLATLRFRTVSARAYERVRDRVAVVNAELAETFGGVRVVQSMGGRDRSGAAFRDAVAAHREARLIAQRQTALYFPFVEFTAQLATFLVLAVGAQLVQRDSTASGALTSGALTAFLLSVTVLFGPVQQLTVVLDTWQQAGAALAKLRGLFDETPSVVDATTDPNGAGARSTREVDRRAPAIEFRNVRFRYRSASRDALQTINLSIGSGETVALVGSTGAGKSTVMKLIPRFYDPSEGSVLVDGVDLRSLPMDAWRRRLGLVVQENVLFTGTVGENVAFARPDATRKEIEAALRLVGADDLVENERGIDTVVARKGASLSAGQRQLIALARAALVEPDVLLLDEATANLDLETEARVQAAMGVLAADRTTVVIAHRLETARRADRIVVIEDGRIVEQGSHDVLMSLAGRYAQLWTAAHRHA